MASKWIETRLGDLYDVYSGLSKPREEFGFGHPFLTFKDVFYNYFLPDRLGSLANTTGKERGKCSIKRGDVFLTRTSETVDELGMSSVALKDYPEATFNGFTKRLRQKPDSTVCIDPVFIGYYLRSQAFRQQVNAISSITTRASLNASQIDALEVRLPEYEEQVHIGEMLKPLDDKIELNRRMNGTLEALAQAVFKEWFVDFGHPAVNGLVKSELGDIPKNWVVGTIESLCESISSGSTPARLNDKYWKNGSIPWFKTGELMDGPLLDSEEHITEAGLADSSCKLWEAGTLLFALYASPTVGRLGLLTKSGTSNQAAAGLVAKEEYGVPFLRRMLLSIRTELQHIAVGAAQQNISQRILRAHKVVVPPAQIAKSYAELVTPLDEKQIALAEESRTLTALRDTLLPKLMRGEVRVKQTPASNE